MALRNLKIPNGVGSSVTKFAEDEFYLECTRRQHTRTKYNTELSSREEVCSSVACVRSI